MTDTCQIESCDQPARGAIKTTDGTKLTTVIYYDDREAPKIAHKMCKVHLAATLVALVTDLVADA